MASMNRHPRGPARCSERPLAAVFLIAAVAAPACGPGGLFEGERIGRVPVERPARRIGAAGGAPIYRKEILTEVYTVDRIYKSMSGPMGMHRFEIDPGGGRELLWITGFQAEMVAPDGRTPMSRELMCHSNLSLRPGPGFNFQFPTTLQPTGGRLFTLAQGQLAIALPEGFGVPVLANQTVQIAAQVLNHNAVERPFEVRHQLSVDYVRDRDLAEPLAPLMPRAVFAMKKIEGDGGHFGVAPDDVDETVHGEGCQVGLDAGTQFPSVLRDEHGRAFSAHWILEPGREENHTLVTRLLDLPYDTTLHYVAVHLHPFAEYVELRDLTARRTVYRSRARNVPGRIGLAEVEYFSSAPGLPIYKDHEYEVVSVYNNTSGGRQDSMATMFLYLAAKDLDLSRFRRAGSGG